MNQAELERARALELALDALEQCAPRTLQREFVDLASERLLDQVRKRRAIVGGRGAFDRALPSTSRRLGPASVRARPEAPARVRRAPAAAPPWRSASPTPRGRARARTGRATPGRSAGRRVRPAGRGARRSESRRENDDDSGDDDDAENNNDDNDDEDDTGKEMEAMTMTTINDNDDDGSGAMKTTAAAPRRRQRGDGEEVVQQDSLLSRYIFRVALHEEGNYVFFPTPILNAKLVLKSSQQLRIPSAKKLKDLAQISEDGIHS